MRTFASGATRSSSKNKNDFFGFRHPLVELSFANYMRSHQVQEDGQLREPNNWWKGWSTDISLQSMIRHIEDLQALHAGLYAYEIDGEKIYSKEKLKGREITKEDCLNAIRFNCGAYLLELLKNK